MASSVDPVTTREFPARNSQPAQGRRWDRHAASAGADAIASLVIDDGLMRRLIKVVVLYDIVAPGGGRTATVAITSGAGAAFDHSLPDITIAAGLLSAVDHYPPEEHILHRDDVLTVTLPAGDAGAVGSIYVESEVIGLPEV